MSIYGMMRTSISGMAAQAHRLTAVSDNIANADTTGYKRSSIEFTSLVVPGAIGSSRTVSLFESGSVVSHARLAISDQGTFRYTTSATDLALDGNGFFVVSGNSGAMQLSRSGSFVPDSEGNLYNSAGHYLQGYPVTDGQVPSVVNGFAGLGKINVRNADLVATPSTAGKFSVNLPSADPVVTGSLPSANSASSVYSRKSSITVFDNLGNSKIVDIYMTKTAENTWELSVFDQANAGVNGGFPYSTPPLATENFTFSPTNGKLDAGSPKTMVFAVPGGASLNLDLSGTTQLGAGFSVSDANINGNAPAAIDRTEVRGDGTVYAGYTDGSFRAIYKIPVATVTSPDQLSAITGTAFEVSADSGGVVLGFANEGSAGRIVSSALEQSNVDIAEELTVMIQAQRGYSANSKVFQTGSEVTDIAISLKR